MQQQTASNKPDLVTLTGFLGRKPEIKTTKAITREIPEKRRSDETHEYIRLAVSYEIPGKEFLTAHQLRDRGRPHDRTDRGRRMADHRPSPAEARMARHRRPGRPGADGREDYRDEAKANAEALQVDGREGGETSFRRLRREAIRCRATH